MVKFRGIDISIISQFDIRRLPEFSPPPSLEKEMNYRPTDHDANSSIASCYVPIYPGSQIWFEYAIDGPHPPKAAYFFKMLHRGQVVTSWDCTGKNDYYGKVMYNLLYIGNDNYTGIPLVKRQTFKFSAYEPQVKNVDDDCIEIRVHRIEHRQKIPVDGDVAASFVNNQVQENRNGDGFCLTNGGLLEPGQPQIRYRYQLLDPVNQPHATFRFYYRTYEFLEDHNIVRAEGESDSSYLSVAEQCEPAKTGSNHQDIDNCTSTTSSSLSSPSSSYDHLTPAQPRVDVIHASDGSLMIGENKSKDQPGGIHTDSRKQFCTVLSEESRHGKIINNTDETGFPEQQASPERQGVGQCESPSKIVDTARMKICTSPFVGFEGVQAMNRKRRPLSPFTNSGMLRKMLSPLPQSAPPALTEFGPTIQDEVDIQLMIEREKREEATEQKCVRTTREERGGNTLMGFLGRRFARSE